MSRNFWHLSDIIWTPSQIIICCMKSRQSLSHLTPWGSYASHARIVLMALRTFWKRPKTIAVYRMLESFSSALVTHFHTKIGIKNMRHFVIDWIKRKTKTNQTCLNYFPVLCVSLINMYLPSVLIVLLDCVMPGWRDFVGFGFTILSWKLLCLICFYTEVKEKVMWISRRWSSVLLCIFFFWCLRFLFALILVEGKFSHGDSCLCLCMYCRHCQSLHVSGDSDMIDL